MNNRKSLDRALIENREKRSLLAIRDNYPKIILTMDKEKNKEIEGIKVINIIDFLTEK
jgi:predicted AAA+ superfamily ATPase